MAPANFFSLPPELRDMIYAFVLQLYQSVILRSPRRLKAADREHWRTYRHLMVNRPWRKTAPAIALLLVNKQTYTEGSKIFYSINTFDLANNSYGSTSRANLHGLQAFIRRVPATHVAYIKKLVVKPVLRWEAWYKNDETSGWDEQLAHDYNEMRPTDPEQKDVESLARTVARRFTGVQTIYMKVFIPYVEQPLPNSYNLETIIRVLSRVFKMRSLKDIKLDSGSGRHRDAYAILERFLEIVPETSGHVRVINSTG